MRLRWTWLALVVGACSGGDGAKTGDDDVTGDDDDVAGDDDDVTGDDDDVTGDDDDVTGDDDDDLPPASDLAAEYERARRLAYANCTQTLVEVPGFLNVFDEHGWLVSETQEDEGALVSVRNTAYVRMGGVVTESVAARVDYRGSPPCDSYVAAEGVTTTYDAGERQLSRTAIQVDGCGTETSQTQTFEYDLVGGLLVEGRVLGNPDGPDIITYDDCGLPVRYAYADGTTYDYVNVYADECIPSELEIVGLGTLFYENGRIVRFEVPLGKDILTTTYVYDCL